MNTTFLNFLRPAKPSEFTGMQEHIRSFREILPKLWQHELRSQFLLIVGEAGTGKSSLLNAYMKISQDEGIIVHQFTPRLGTASRTFLRELQTLIIPHAKKIKKGLFRLTLRSKSLPEITDRTNPNRLARTFVKELIKHEFSPEIRIIIFIDSLERLVNTKFISPLLFLSQLGKELKSKKMPVFIVGAIELRAYHQIQTFIDINPFITLTRFSPKDANHFLVTKGPPIMKKEQLRNFCIQSSDRTPFSLLFAIDLVNWAIQDLQKEKKIQEIANTTLVTSKIDHFLKKMDLEEFISRVLPLSPGERRVLAMILDSPQNVMTLHELQQQIPDFWEHLKRLEKLGLIHVEEEAGLTCLTSQALHAKSRTRQGGTITADVAATEMEVLLQLMEAEILSGVRPTKMLSARLEKILEKNISSPKNAQKLAEATEKIFDSAILQQFHDEAYRFALITGRLLDIAGKHSLAGAFLENAASTFSTLKKDLLTTELLKRSLYSYEKANQAQKVREIAEITVNLYITRAKRHLQQKPPQFQLARMNYYQALKMLHRLDNPELQQRLLKDIERTYAKNEDLVQERLSFFTSLVESTKKNE